jgi:4-amino-4-deoxy-L-arabinose transferase-like glycosyltransferase
MSLFQKTFLLGILLLATLLRLYRLADHGLFFDEKVTLLVSQGVAPGGANLTDVLNKPYFTPQEIWREKHLADYFEAMARGDWGNSAAHYLLLHYWTQLFGLSDFSLRFLSVLFSIAFVGLMYHFVRRHFNNTWLGLLVAALAAVEPFFVSQSHIVRNYSMSLFLTLLATHLLLRCVQSPRRVGLLVAYSLCVTASLMSHYLTFMVFVGHGFYVLFAIRQWHIWLRLGFSMLLPALSLFVWMTWGGGQYSLKTVKDVEVFYQQIARNPPKPNPYAGWIDPATPPVVLSKSVKATADYLILTNSLSEQLLGKTNLLLSLVPAMMLILLLVVANKKQDNRWYALMIPLVVGAWWGYSVAPWAFTALSACWVLILLFGLRIWQGHYPKTIALTAILAILPLGWMVLQAFKSGHTVGINLRYLAFGLPYVTILAGLLLYELSHQRNVAGGLLLIMLVPQGYWLSQTLRRVYDDQAPQYAYFKPPRVANPYAEAGQRLSALYQPGDTIIYPNNARSVFSRANATTADSAASSVDVFDALLVNMYLPPDAQFVQRIDAHEPDKIILWQKSTQKPKVIFNFEGLKYRY